MACAGEFTGGFVGVLWEDCREQMFKGVGIRAGWSSLRNLILVYYRTNQLSPSSRNVLPETLQRSTDSELSVISVNNYIPRVGIEIP